MSVTDTLCLTLCATEDCVGGADAGDTEDLAGLSLLSAGRNAVSTAHRTDTDDSCAYCRELQQ